ncbi:Protein fam72a [Quaeritorhiza haematococci]|nr:Protein fam72a [Quaeritorhiza haematococci]
MAQPLHQTPTAAASFVPQRSEFGSTVASQTTPRVVSNAVNEPGLQGQGRIPSSMNDGSSGRTATAESTSTNSATFAATVTAPSRLINAESILNRFAPPVTIRLGVNSNSQQQQRQQGSLQITAVVPATPHIPRETTHRVPASAGGDGGDGTGAALLPGIDSMFPQPTEGEFMQRHPFAPISSGTVSNSEIFDDVEGGGEGSGEEGLMISDLDGGRYAWVSDAILRRDQGRGSDDSIGRSEGEIASGSDDEYQNPNQENEDPTGNEVTSGSRGGTGTIPIHTRRPLSQLWPPPTSSLRSAAAQQPVSNSSSSSSSMSDLGDVILSYFAASYPYSSATSMRGAGRGGIGTNRTVALSAGSGTALTRDVGGIPSNVSRTTGSTAVDMMLSDDYDDSSNDEDDEYPPLDVNDIPRPLTPLPMLSSDDSLLDRAMVYEGMGELDSLGVRDDEDAESSATTRRPPVPRIRSRTTAYDLEIEEMFSPFLSRYYPFSTARSIFERDSSPPPLEPYEPYTERQSSATSVSPTAASEVGAAAAASIRSPAAAHTREGEIGGTGNRITAPVRRSSLPLHLSLSSYASMSPTSTAHQQQAHTNTGTRPSPDDDHNDSSRFLSSRRPYSATSGRGGYSFGFADFLASGGLRSVSSPPSSSSFRYGSQRGSQRGSSAPQTASARPHFRSKPVHEVSCRHCGTVVCKRGMKAILLADMNIELFSTDFPPRVELVNEDYTTQNCFCSIRDAACLDCGSVIGYHV